MINTKLSFFVDIAQDDKLLNNIKSFFSASYNLDDVFIFSKDMLLSFINRNFAILPLYYFKFYSGIVVFFTLEDYLEYSEEGMNTNSYLFMNENTIKDIDAINRNMIKDIQMIGWNKDKNCIEEIRMVTI